MSDMIDNSEFERCINASDLIDWIIETCPDWCEGAIRTIVDHIDEMPSAQPEIVCCKDCKHIRRWRSEEAAQKFGQIYECAYGVFRVPHADDFCSKAERREDE